MSKRTVIAVVAAVAAFGAVTASATTLGGLNSKSLGAESSVVAACDTDGVSVDYTTSYDATAKEYTVSAIALSGLAAACNGQSARVTVANAAGASLGNGTATVAGTSSSITLSTPASAKNVANVAVVITG